MTTQEKIEVMKAYAEGGKIQVKERNGSNWKDYGDILAPEWNWGDYDYRIKLEPVYRPYKDTAEMIEDFKKRFNAKVPPYAMPMIWVRIKGDSDFAMLITEFGYSSVWCSVIQEGIPLKKLFEDYVYLDGSPCGMKEGL